ncbi:dockerin type I repeat-containing protein [Ruminococcus sp.]|uniref:dockerin type I repeat-containing protein n=1 Tax=Ruminococcus sp. TaxID=41978 RepID=UPI0025E86FF4|nr:dockerin type I repeat-containing protein [Ruminococcus sp.]
MIRKKIFTAIAAVVLSAANALTALPSWTAAANGSETSQTQNAPTEKSDRTVSIYTGSLADHTVQKSGTCTLKISCIDITTGEKTADFTYDYQIANEYIDGNYPSGRKIEKRSDEVYELYPGITYSFSFWVQGMQTFTDSYFVHFDSENQTKELVVKAYPKSTAKNVHIKAHDLTGISADAEKKPYDGDKLMEQFQYVYVYDENGELFARTAMEGQNDIYLPDGKYSIKVIPALSYSCTEPGGNVLPLEVKDGKPDSDLDFCFEKDDSSKVQTLGINVIDAQTGENIDDISFYVNYYCEYSAGTPNFPENYPAFGGSYSQETESGSDEFGYSTAFSSELWEHIELFPKKSILFKTGTDEAITVPALRTYYQISFISVPLKYRDCYIAECDHKDGVIFDFTDGGSVFFNVLDEDEKNITVKLIPVPEEEYPTIGSCSADISVVDMDTGENIENVNARLTLEGSTTRINVGKWNTSDSPSQSFSQLRDSVNYRLELSNVPEEYVCETSCSFRFDNDGEKKDITIRARKAGIEPNVPITANDWTGFLFNDNAKNYGIRKMKKPVTVTVYGENGSLFVQDTITAKGSIYLPDGKYILEATTEKSTEFPDYKPVSTDEERVQRAAELLPDEVIPDGNRVELTVSDGLPDKDICFCFEEGIETPAVESKLRIHIIDSETGETPKDVVCKVNEGLSYRTPREMEYNTSEDDDITLENLSGTYNIKVYSPDQYNNSFFFEYSPDKGLYADGVSLFEVSFTLYPKGDNDIYIKLVPIDSKPDSQGDNCVANVSVIDSETGEYIPNIHCNVYLSGNDYNIPVAGWNSADHTIGCVRGLYAGQNYLLSLFDIPSGYICKSDVYFSFDAPNETKDITLYAFKPENTNVYIKALDISDERPNGKYIPYKNYRFMGYDEFQLEVYDAEGNAVYRNAAGEMFLPDGEYTVKAVSPYYGYVLPDENAPKTKAAMKQITDYIIAANGELSITVKDGQMAEKCCFLFINEKEYSEAINYGDSNCDGTVDLADAVLIMQALANPDKYGLNGSSELCITAKGLNNADVDSTVKGLTSNDALCIQKYLLGIITALPV